MTKQRFLRNTSIKRKVMSVGLLTTGFALLSITLVLLVGVWIEGRRHLVDASVTHAEVIALNAAPALLFDDRKAAVDTLAALKAVPDVIFAALYDAQGRKFAVGAYSAGAANEMPCEEVLARLETLLQQGDTAVNDLLREKREVLHAALGDIEESVLHNIAAYNYDTALELLHSGHVTEKKMLALKTPLL